jgi:hypothetical protein
MRRADVPEYVKLYEDVLKIPSDFLDRYRRVIASRLAFAQSEIEDDEGSFAQDVLYGVHQCFHLANSVILLAGRGNNLDRGIRYIRESPKYRSILTSLDPTMILSVAVLCYIFGDQERHSNDPAIRSTVTRRLRERLDNINWMVGKDAMTVLGIELVSEKKESPTST